MRRKTFRPMVDPMEPRLALSSGNSLFSGFNDLIDNLLGKNPTSDTSSSQTTHLTAAQIAQAKARKQNAILARQERLAELHAAHSHPHVHPTFRHR